MNAKATPGPWLAVFMPDGEGGEFFDGFIRPLPDGGAEDVDIERRANAALVAAAPTMLEALKAMVLSAGLSPYGFPGNPLHAALAAIAKAEGRGGRDAAQG